MKHRLGILFLLLSLFVAAPGSSVWACGNNAPVKHQPASAPKSCCSKKGDSKRTHCAQETKTCEQQHPGQGCPLKGGCGDCHCPGCGASCHSPVAFTATEDLVSVAVISSGSEQKQAFYFADHLPEPVCLPIWQPPKLSA